jgi:phage FluMu gp28-like protein
LPRDIFQQEYEAVFLSDAASVFRNIRTCIADTYEEPRPGHRYVMGLDLAKFGDFTVITIVDRDSHRVVFWDRFTKLPYTLQKERILNVARKYHCLVVIDAMNVGAAMADELRAEGLSVQDFKATGTISKDIDKQGSKEKMVEKLSLFFEQRNVIIPPEEVLIDELESFSYHLTPSGNLVYGAPEGFHDDCVTSLGLALMPLTGQRRTENIKVARSMPVKRKSFQYF